MSITLWVVVSGKTVVERLGDRDVVHRVVSEWQDRWSQAPGPPSLYSEQATDAVRRGELQRAAERLSMALSIEPNQASDWARMICLSTVRPSLGFTLSPSEIDEILPLLRGLDVGPSILENARKLRNNVHSRAVNNSLILRCFGVTADRVETETNTETLDTMPTTP